MGVYQNKETGPAGLSPRLLPRADAEEQGKTWPPSACFMRLPDHFKALQNLSAYSEKLIYS